MTGTSPGAALVPMSEFGPYDALADDAHGLYVDGFSSRAVELARRYLALTTAAGDVVTSRYLRYITAIAFQDYGRHEEAVAEATRLADELGDAFEPVWRAKALSVVAESATRLGEHGKAIAAMAEADWLLRSIPVHTYGHLSASMGVALCMRSVNLYEQAEATLLGIQGDDPHNLVALEAAILSAYWAASLVMIGREDEAAGHFAACVQRALRFQRLAGERGDPEMVARGEVIEAFATMHLGQPELAASRARAAQDRFTFRIELVETYLLNLVLGRDDVRRGRVEAAQDRLRTVQSNAIQTGREVWSFAAMGDLAELAALESGPHTGMELWRSIAQDALLRAWSEREGRFAALRDQNLLRELAAHSARMGRAVVQDPLTGLGNRRMLDSLAETRAGSLTVVFIDVDDFKSINDTYTHAVGDKVLRELAGILRLVSREEDRLVRFGGDEFVILTDSPLDGAVALAHRVHGAVRSHAWDGVAPGLTVTVSVGVGRVSDTGPGSLLAADAALMSAKRGGRDQVVVDSR